MAAPTEVAPPFTAPANYTPRHLAERILSYRSSLEGEHKSVTVLFCDITESMALAQRIGSEAMFGLLNRFFETALAEVHRYEGTINQFLGDGFMAIFGAPLALEWHARQAVQAAVAIRDAVRDCQVAITGSVGLELAVRFGLNTGLVVVPACRIAPAERLVIFSLAAHVCLNHSSYSLIRKNHEPSAPLSSATPAARVRRLK